MCHLQNASFLKNASESLLVYPTAGMDLLSSLQQFSYRHQKLTEMCIWIYIQNPITATSSDCCLWVKKNYLRAQTNLVLRQLVTAACLRATSVVPGCSDPILWPAVEMQELWKMPGRDQREVSHPAKCSYFCIHQRMNQITPECEN